MRVAMERSNRANIHTPFSLLARLVKHPSEGERALPHLLRLPLVLVHRARIDSAHKVQHMPHECALPCIHMADNHEADHLLLVLHALGVLGLDVDHVLARLVYLGRRLRLGARLCKTALPQTVPCMREPHTITAPYVHLLHKVGCCGTRFHAAS